MGNVVCLVNTYLLDSDLSDGKCYPAFEQLGPGFHDESQKPELCKVLRPLRLMGSLTMIVSHHEGDY